MSVHKLTSPLSLRQASAIVDAALAAGRDADLLPLTVVVLDVGGHMIVLKREDGSGIARADLAVGKAWGALGLGLPSRVIGEANQDRLAFLNALAAASHGRAVPVAGGVLVCDADDVVIGAVGVSGDNSDNDERCAITGIEATGLKPAPAG